MTTQNLPSPKGPSLKFINSSLESVETRKETGLFTNPGASKPIVMIPHKTKLTVIQYGGSWIKVEGESVGGGWVQTEDVDFLFDSKIRLVNDNDFENKDKQNRISFKKTMFEPTPQIYSNGTWTVVIGNFQSWHGQNGTGDLTYWGCNKDCECINLRYGTVNEISPEETLFKWENGEYVYTFKTDIVEYIPILTVYKNGTEILKVNDFSLVPYANQKS